MASPTPIAAISKNDLSPEWALLVPEATREPKGVALDRRASQTSQLERIAGTGIIAPQRNYSAHLRRPWRDILNQSPPRAPASAGRSKFESAADRHFGTVGRARGGGRGEPGPFDRILGPLCVKAGLISRGLQLGLYQACALRGGRSVTVIDGATLLQACLADPRMGKEDFRSSLPRRA
jgi:hypothetical protein